MSRPLACICFGFLAARLLCVHAPLAALLLPAAFCAIRFVLRRIDRMDDNTSSSLFLISAGMGAAALLSLLQMQCLVAPLTRQAGREIAMTVRVESVGPSYQDGMNSGILTVEAEDGGEGGYRVYSGAFPAAEPGDRFRARFLLNAIGDSEYRLADYAEAAFLEAEYLGDHQLLDRSEGLKYRLTRLSRGMARTVVHTLAQPYAGLVAAMSIGDESFLTEELSLVFRRSGISHLLVVSGLHVTLASRLITGRRARKARFQRLRAALSMVFTLFLMGLVGMTPSVVRAGIAMMISDIGCFWLTTADPLTSLGVAGVVLCAANPYAVCDLGFQLSFCACLGLCACGWLIGRLEHRGEETFLRSVWFALLNWVLPSVFAALFTLPVQLLQGLMISGASIAGNLLTTWLSGPITILGLLACAVGLLPGSGVAVKLLLLPAGLCAKLLVALARKAAVLPFAVLPLPRAYTLFVLSLLTAIVLLCLRFGLARWLGALLPVTVSAAVLFGLWLGRDVVSIRLTGAANNACAVVSQNGEALVLFRGGAANWNRVRQQLAQLGIDRPELVVDLRQNPSNTALFDAEQIVRVEDLASGEPAVMRWQGMYITLLDQNTGNLAALDADGYLIAMHTGSPVFFDTVAIDLLLAPNSIPQGLEPAAILTCRIPEKSGDAVVYSGAAPVAELRPGRSIRFAG